MIKKLEWDSDFFNLEVGEINGDEKYQGEDVSGYDLIYVISKEDIQLDIQHFENTFSEVKVIFAKTIENEKQLDAPIFDYEKLGIDKEELYFLAYESGKNSRFLLDGKLDQNHFRKLYKAWVDNSVNKKFADGVLVYFEQTQLKGFVTYKIKEEAASVGLIAVHPEYQGQGIGSKLLKYLENLSLEKGVTQITIPTQLSNIQACNFYEKQGYSIKSKTYIKHFWKI